VVDFGDFLELFERFAMKKKNAINLQHPRTLFRFAVLAAKTA